MSYTYHGTTGLIALPGRSVQTFPSGLVRIDRTYAIRKDRVTQAREELAVGNPLPLDEGEPAIDGAFIYPAVQETQRDDGFYEFRASAYGRTQSGYSAIQTREVFRFGRNIRFSVFEFTAEIVQPSLRAVALPDIGEFEDLIGIQSVTPAEDREVLAVVFIRQRKRRTRFGFRLLRRYRIDLSLVGLTDIVQSVTIEVADPAPSIIEQRNFGRFSEYVINFGNRFSF
jgi:hypothetical protein